MDDKFHTYLKKAGDEVTLSPSEHARMRGVLNAYMEMKPIRSASRASVWSTQWFFSMRPPAATLVLALFVSSAGVSYAAEGALPGDTLYTVKVSVNEPIAGALAVTSSAKAEWAMRVAGERIKEAATLAAEGRLSTETQDELQTSFETYSALAIQHIDEEADANPDTGGQSAVRFEARLSEYGRVLAEVGGAEYAADTLASAIRTQHDRIAGIRTRAEAKSATIASSGNAAVAASRMRDAAKHQLDDSVSLALHTAESFSSSSADVLERELQEAGTSIADGEKLLGRNSTQQEALEAFRGALTKAEKIGIFLQTSSAIHRRTGRIVSEPERTGKPSVASKAAAKLQNTLTAGEGPSITATMSVEQETQPSAFTKSSATGSIESDTSPDSSRQDSPRDFDSKSGRDENREEDSDGEDPLIRISAPSSLLP
ncbi:hypothetical protein A3C20_01910 [Candidatus Kaiserbacteria bacterium RIFCSPHIGHO2_02_FULL_55_25]|uniref:DUF5667 domain-containing protein n=1 Tax=Candidatus Kaiserbacteria bacterium RIFCSPHIGHO2_02_FULL_55_25 TaxID=1798498 RepID=A0A1F6E483_9BACT|nr:MAG: hypothetical protein A2764_00175 [Candidatus Kaiserbacteria bacterium RIFCSPHIGHO2_01_FULL_55_79]OGG68468.1 MAG: hypothetical protein A3C20_01910 [Candidatus Kaiserbacteria bacterium RIFCSPHIGHO2_02_FULL_55_25]OGG78406.1 MAG: hypothetical protein A3F56_03190 [Candidatus Kaiserbacteria bacterium RIFCSPHIGHO2_12_FULL_55_13]OGG82752.1 MAG: hypothetical protein A3A42_02715 [Candidatus Kaiserbacteria bacterium RIFCSPLOWO2_01_FULL_55_25]